MDANLLKRVGVIGALLAVAAILVFVLLWVVLGETGVSGSQRLFISLCVPPALLSAGIGFYVLFARPKS
jgi:hypothetical protein